MYLKQIGYLLRELILASCAKNQSPVDFVSSQAEVQQGRLTTRSQSGRGPAETVMLRKSTEGSVDWPSAKMPEVAGPFTGGGIELLVKVGKVKGGVAEALQSPDTPEVACQGGVKDGTIEAVQPSSVPEATRPSSMLSTGNVDSTTGFVVRVRQAYAH